MLRKVQRMSYGALFPYLEENVGKKRRCVCVFFTEYINVIFKRCAMCCLLKIQKYKLVD